MKKSILLIVVICVLGIIYLFANSSPSSSEENSFVVGTNAEYPPYTYIENGEIVGFDIDVAREVCKRLGKTISLRDVPFESLIAELSLKRVDFIAAGMTKTEERAKRVAFTTPYFSEDTLVIVSRLDAPYEDIQTLHKKNVIVNEGYTADGYASQFDTLNLIRLPAPADAFLALKNGRGDAFITAKSTVDNFNKEVNGNDFHIYPIESASEGVSLVIAKDNNNLQEKVELALEAMIEDGTLLHLKEKWGLL